MSDAVTFPFSEIERFSLIYPVNSYYAAVLVLVVVWVAHCSFVHLGFLTQKQKCVEKPKLV